MQVSGKIPKDRKPFFVMVCQTDDIEKFNLEDRIWIISTKNEKQSLIAIDFSSSMFENRHSISDKGKFIFL